MKLVSTHRYNQVLFSHKVTASALAVGTALLAEDLIMVGGTIRSFLRMLGIQQSRLLVARILAKHKETPNKNGDRADNRICNLELWTTSQPSGQRVKDKLKWAKEFIKTYESH